jgi:peptidoglycan/LPS O-acetylase OafA/YrhL
MFPITVPGAVLYIDFFFAASAYYITSLLLRDIEKRGRIDYGQFYLRRFARLVPPLLLMLAVYLLCSWLFLPAFSAALKRAAIVLSYTSNYWYVFDPKSIEDLGHTWTLSTEEQFYILWPVIFAFLVRRLGLTWRLAMAIGAIAAAIWAWRILLVLQGAGPLRLYTALDTRADALMGGMRDGRGPEAGPAWKISNLGWALAQPGMALVAVLGRGHLSVLASDGSIVQLLLFRQHAVRRHSRDPGNDDADP